MTSLLFAEVNKLKNIQFNLEKNELLLLEYIAKYLDIQIMEDYKRLEISRNKEIEASRNELKNLLILSNNIKDTSNGPLHCIDFKQLKRNMELMQTTTQELKQRIKSNLDELCKGEVELWKEIKTYEIRMHEWAKLSILTPNLFREQQINKIKKIDQRVSDFLTFIARGGGHENGWSIEDHNLFLKIKARCRSKQEVAQHLHAILPDISEEEVIAHDKWYIKYMELKDKHREAIKKWRLSKSAPKLRVEKQAGDDQRRPVTSISAENLSRKQMKEKVKMWQEEKKQKLRTERELKEQEEIQKRQLEEKRKQKYEELRETIQNWKSANAEKKQTEKVEKLMMEQKIKEFKSAMANRLIKEFQSQDEIFMERRKKNIKSKIKTEVKSNSGVIVPRDPSRLLKPTKQWILRTNDEQNDQKIQSICSIKHVPKLGVPEWRKQLVL